MKSGGSTDYRSPSTVFELVGRAARLASCRRVWNVLLFCFRSSIGLIKLITDVWPVRWAMAFIVLARSSYLLSSHFGIASLFLLSIIAQSSNLDLSISTSALGVLNPYRLLGVIQGKSDHKHFWAKSDQTKAPILFPEHGRDTTIMFQVKIQRSHWDIVIKLNWLAEIDYLISKIIYHANREQLITPQLPSWIYSIYLDTIRCSTSGYSGPK